MNNLEQNIHLATKHMLQDIDDDKFAVNKIHNNAIDHFWVLAANAMALTVMMKGSTIPKQCSNKKDLRAAFGKMALLDRAAAFYFITGYIKDFLFPSAMMGITHQSAMKHYICKRLNIMIVDGDDLKHGQKDSIEKAYGTTSNRKKQKLNQNVFPNHLSVQIYRGSGDTTNATRDKHVYYIHQKRVDDVLGNSVEARVEKVID